MQCFTIVREGRRRPENCYSTEDKRLYLLNTEADILGEVGFTRLVKHSQRARRWIRCSCDIPDIEAEIEIERGLFCQLQVHVFKLHGPLSRPLALQWGASSLNATVRIYLVNSIHKVICVPLSGQRAPASTSGAFYGLPRCPSRNCRLPPRSRPPELCVSGLDME
jgi:hypothetical protein